MFKARLGPWGLNKNSKNNDWGAIAKLHKIRKESGKSATEFLVHGRKRTLAQLRKHIKSRSMTDQQFLAAALDLDIPSYIRCYTPEPDIAADGVVSASQRDLPLAYRTPAIEKGLGLCTRSRSPQVPVTNLPNRQSKDENPSIAGHSTSDVIALMTAPPPLTRSWDPQQCPSGNKILMISPPQIVSDLSVHLSAPCQHVQSQLNQMAEQALVSSAAQESDFEDLEAWVFLTSSLDGAENGPILTCSRCDQSVFSHLTTLDDYVHIDRCLVAAASARPPSNSVLASEQRAAALKWVVRCFAACIYMTHGTSDFAHQSFVDAEAEVENLLATNNPLTLTSLNLILSILHVHDQGQIVESIVGSALKVASKVLGSEDSITVTIAWMTAAAGQKLPQAGLDTSVLRRAYSDFTERLGDDHPHAITALYNLSWNLINDGAWDEAESSLRGLYRTSCNVLGPSHMQSITALTSLSRVLSNQNKNDAAIETMQQAIERSENTLGPSHPYRLESKRRLALMYEKINDKPQMESLYWDVLQGRVKMLGRVHPYTVGAKVDLIRLLQGLGKWEDGGPIESSINALFEQQDDFRAWHEAF